MPRSLILMLLLACGDKDTPRESTCSDCDEDGFAAPEDCDDTNPEINPDQADACGDDVDQDCDLVDPTCPCSDGDGDGHPAADEADCDSDCDDDNPYVNPAATESCDGADNDCDGDVDEVWSATSGADTGAGDTGVAGTAPDETLSYTAYALDADGDGYGDAAVIHYACAPPDGFVTDMSDCDDADPADHPGADEICDDPNDDDDCDGFSDNEDDFRVGEVVLYRDDDLDTHGSTSETLDGYCDPIVIDGVSWVLSSDDCDDTDPLISPDGNERCDDADADEDCDGLVDDDDDSVDTASMVDWYQDVDGDGFTPPTASASVETRCGPRDASYKTPSDTEDEDCDDDNAAINHSATECCNLVDDDCDGVTDEDDAEGAPTWYLDADADGLGDPSHSVRSCYEPSGYVADDTDCDDSDPLVRDGDTYCYDADLDTYGWAGTTAKGCSPPDGYVADCTDCDDTAPSYHAREEYYRDTDGDHYGASGTTTTFCGPATGRWVAYDGDCDESNARVNPGAEEICNGVDDNCNGAIDDEDIYVIYTSNDIWYADIDGDGYGDASPAVQSCATPTPGTYVKNSTDCDDEDADINPSAPEICNLADDNCDDVIDEGVEDKWYADTDEDGYGSPTSYKEACSAPSSAFVSNDQDCDDGDRSFYPGAEEGCDGLDQDCDGTPDSESTCEPYLDGEKLTAAWHSSDGHAYLFFTSTKTWPAADAFCRELGYHLVTIDDSSEQSWLWPIATSLSSTASLWYTGLYENESSGAWRWTSQESMTGDPDCSTETDGLYNDEGELIWSDFIDTDRGQGCGLLIQRDGEVGWEDSECGTDDDRYFICESCSGFDADIVYGGADVLY